MEKKYYTFPCGCKFEQLGDTIKDYDGLPPIKIDYYNIKLDCPKTWNLLSSGYTRGIFQLESNLGMTFGKKLKPDNIDHLAALTAILRPGVLQYLEDGKSMTNHYIDRKLGTDEVSYITPELEEFLGITYGVLVYQEQMIKMVKKLGGFTAEQANALRKYVGKKMPDKLYAMRGSFVEGCIKNNIEKNIAEKIFDNIEKAGRYSFNSSHSYAYGVISYLTAYTKAHFPLHFFTSYLNRVKDQDELRELASELSIFGLDIKTVTADSLQEKFHIKDGYIKYGISSVKSVGEGSAKKLIEIITETEKKLNKEFIQFTWLEFLIYIVGKSSSKICDNLISSGFMDHLGLSRRIMLKEHSIFSDITTSGIKWIEENINPANEESLLTILEKLSDAISTNKRMKSSHDKIVSNIQLLKKPTSNREDSIEEICKLEEAFLGIQVTKSRTRDKEHLSTQKCLDISLGKGYNNIRVVAEVLEVDERPIKTGKNAGKKMANISIKDSTGHLAFPIFSADWISMKSTIVKGNVLLFNFGRNQDKSIKLNDAQLL